MDHQDEAGANSDQVAYWNAAAGQTWAELQDRLDAQLQPLGERLLQALAPTPGEAVLDIGCGCGATTLALAEAVGPDGAVTGVDISYPMLEVARRRVGAAGLSQARLVEADAQTHGFAPGGFDAAFSRFGVMFFSDPAAAFANIRGGLKPGGRLAFICWRALPQNPWMLVPVATALERLAVPAPPPPDPLAPGPFAFADPDRVRSILERAGYAQIEITPHDQKIGARDLDQAAAIALKVGPLGALLREQPDKAPMVVDAVRDALAQHLTPEGVRLDSATWIVQARAP
ncbi:MAG: class I SAM-dependent methyltransferase [Caulobacteraceae bacterium]|nr:class I SAM-dependent methyltransferase [Caulobacteraceae bacterium]